MKPKLIPNPWNTPQVDGRSNRWRAVLIWLALTVLLAAPPVQAARIMFVTSAATPVDKDQAITNRLISNGGHTVTVRAATVNSDAGRNALKDEATTNDYALVIVSESITSGNVGNAFRSLAKPVIVMEAFIFDDMLMTGLTSNTDFGQSDTNQTQIEITNTTHALAAGLSGTVTVYSTTGFRVGWGRTLGSGVIRVATVVGAPTDCVLFAYEPGAQMVGMAAPARRVGCFLWGTGTGVPYTAEAFRILDAAVTWALEPTFIAPAVTITNPIAGVTFAANSDISIQVQTQDFDGNVTNVSYFAESYLTNRLIGQVASAPFTLTWTNVPEGRYRLTALATDNSGLGGNSASVAITVGSPPPPALFVVNSLALPVGDLAIRDLLHGMNIEVETAQAAAATSGDATGKRLVLVSSTITSGDVAAKFRAVTVPVIAWESFIYDDMSLCGLTANVDFGTTNGQTQVEIVNAGHPLAGGLPAGLQTVVSNALPFSWGLPAGDATIVARVAEDPGKAVIFGYSTGALMADGFVAPARRVGLFMQDTTPANFTTEGRTLFQAAVNWALGTEPIELQITRNGNDIAISWPEAGSAGYNLESSAQLPSTEPWQPVTQTPTVQNGRKMVTLPLEPVRHFFRLQK